VTALPPDVEDDLDAFLKRYEQLINAIQDELFKIVAIVGGGVRQTSSVTSARPDSCCTRSRSPSRRPSTWHRISWAGFRNIVVHGYAGVNLEIAKDIVERRLGDLVAFAAVIRARLR
jgi:hypothetical protein